MNPHDHLADPPFVGPYGRWREILLLSPPVQLLVGLAVVVAMPAVLLWGPGFWLQWDAVRADSLWLASLSFMVTMVILHRLGRHAGGAILPYIAPTVSLVFLFAFALLMFYRGDYARRFLLAAYVLSLIWCYAGYFIGRRYRRLKYAVLPVDERYALQSSPGLEFHPLVTPDLRGGRYDAVVADLRGTGMSPAWERFLSRCILANIPVFHARQVMEDLTGRVWIEHLSENALGALLPSPFYVACKRLIDVLVVLLVLPVALPLMLGTALAIRLDSPGPAVFVQNRVGRGNRDFRIYKFRSMRIDAEEGGARLASAADDRITRVGRFIRKTRLDELPQLWNVLKGDMSLIGPRPEQRVFVDQFEDQIPFYIYRHVVRPGITGWAQVMQGYTGTADETRIKLQHDLYYIKYFSFWLDLLIALKTVRIVLTGWGAR